MVGEVILTKKPKKTKRVKKPGKKRVYKLSQEEKDMAEEMAGTAFVMGGLALLILYALEEAKKPLLNYSKIKEFWTKLL